MDIQEHVFITSQVPGVDGENHAYAVAADRQERIWVGTGTAGVRVFNGYEGEPADAAEGAARARFDACALAVRAYSDNFDVFSVIEKRLLFRLLGETLGLPAKRRKELEKLWK